MAECKQKINWYIAINGLADWYQFHTVQYVKAPLVHILPPWIAHNHDQLLNSCDNFQFRFQLLLIISSPKFSTSPLKYLYCFLIHFQGIRGVWIKMPINLANLIQPAVEVCLYNSITRILSRFFIC